MAAPVDPAGGGAPSWFESLTCRNSPANCAVESDAGDKADWAYVGEGRGAYKVVEQIVWVGEGNGSVEVDPNKNRPPPTQRSDWNRWKAKCCMIFYQCILLMTVVCLVTGTIFAIPSVAGLVTSAWDGIRGLFSRPSDHKSTEDSVRSERLLVNCSAREALSQDDRRLCCHSDHNGCHQVDCGSNSSASMNSAGPAVLSQRHWCCSADFRTHCNGHAYENSSARHSTVAQHESTGNVSAQLPYDCQVGLANWEELWKPDKQQFCCKYGGVGCPRQPVNNATASTVAPAVHQPQGLPFTADGAETTVRPADGARIPAVTVTKQHTLLHSTMRALRRTTTVPTQQTSPDTRVDANAAMEASRASPRRPPAKTAATAFDCDIGIDQWKKIWSVAKKFWCCEYGNRCPM